MRAVEVAPGADHGMREMGRRMRRYKECGRGGIPKGASRQSSRWEPGGFLSTCTSGE